MATVTVQTIQLLRLVHEGFKLPHKRAQNAAHSILSLLVLNLKEERIVVTDAMYPYYKTLRDLTTK